MQERLNVRITANDVFFESGWSGESSFNGLEAKGYGNWDSRRGSITLSMNLGNRNVKTRKRKTGIDEAAKRVSNDD